MSSSEFKDRLERLHGSRKRAEERAERERDHGVFSADDAVERDHPPGEAPDGEADGGVEPPDSEPPSHRDEAPSPGEPERNETGGEPDSEMTYRRAEPSPDEETTADEESSPTERPKTEVGERLARTYSLRNRSDRGESTGDVSRETNAPTGAGDRSLPPNERAEMLRKRAGNRIDAGDWDAALPLLHEILALLPRHSFALEKLANYHRNNGDARLADHYENRLRDVTPF